MTTEKSQLKLNMEYLEELEPMFHKEINSLREKADVYKNEIVYMNKLDKLEAFTALSEGKITQTDYFPAIIKLMKKVNKIMKRIHKSNKALELLKEYKNARFNR